MKKRFLAVLFLILILVLPVAEAFAASVRYISSPNGRKVNLRHGPSESGYAVAVQLEPGTQVKLLSSPKKGWSKVIYNGFTLYVQSRFLSAKKPGSGSSFKEFDGRVYAASGQTVNMRTKPDMKADVITKLPIWTNVRVVGQKGLWYKIVYGSSTGYIKKRYIR